MLCRYIASRDLIFFFYMFYLLKAWLLGIAIAAPIGPIGMLCVNKTLEVGFIGACLVGLGAALADAVYGCVTAFGLNTISTFLLENIKTIMAKWNLIVWIIINIVHTM